jgi:ammonia channel protein AmtB
VDSNDLATGTASVTRPDEVVEMTEIALIGLLAMLVVVIVAGFLNRLLDFDEPSTWREGDLSSRAR